MEAKDKGTDLCEELRILEEIVPEAERNITIDSLINKFSNQHSLIGILMSFMGDLDLQPDLSDYGYTNYSVPVKLYLPEDAIIAEKLKLLRRTAALIRLKDAIENHQAGLPLRTEFGKRYGLIRNDETGELVLDIFNKDHVQQASIIIYKKMVLVDGSYEPQCVAIRYSGDFAGEPGMFYEVVEDLATRGQLASLSIHEYDEASVISSLGINTYDFGVMLPGSPMDRHSVDVCDVPYEKRDLVRGLSLGLHPERIAEICKEENPIGSARKKHSALQ